VVGRLEFWRSSFETDTSSPENESPFKWMCTKNSDPIMINEVGDHPYIQ
jgi:hypothetical protein